jgi:hypothetical protein
MPPLARHRAAATVAAALFAATPLLVTAAAQAAPAPGLLPAESGKEVVFSGDRGLLGVSCAANPSTTAVTIPAETTLRVVNQTGHRAKLLLDGASQGEIADGGAAPVVFHRGPVTLGLKPSCMLSDESAVRVEVVPAARTTAPGTQPRTTSPQQPRGRDQRGEEPAAEPSATPTPSPAVTQTPEPATAGEDGGDPGAAVATVDETSGAGTEGVAAEVLSSVQPVRKTGPIGLLALIATVCAVGVSAGAIRAILAQRATRTGVA